MRILHITYSMEQGGVDTLLIELIQQLQALNVENDILVLSKNISLEKELSKKNIRVIKGKYNNKFDPRNISLIRSYLNKYDIVHSHLFPQQYYLSFATLLKKNKPVLVTTEHCNTNNRRNKSYLNFLENFIYAQYDKVVCVSKSGYNNLKKWLPKNKNITTILNGIGFNRIDNSETYKREIVSSNDEDIIIMMVARFFYQKNHSTAIESLKYLPKKFKLVFIGSGELLESMKNLTNKLGLQDRVQFMGYRNDVPSLIKLADIGLLSSHFEGLPISLLEFMRAAKPIVGSNIDGISDLIQDKRCLFEEGNAKDLALCIEYLQDKKTRDKIGEENKRISENYDIKTTSKNYLRMYMSLLTSKH